MGEKFSSWTKTNKQTNKQTSKKTLFSIWNWTIENNDSKERELTKLNCFKYRHFCITQGCLHQVFKLVQTNTDVHFVFSLKWRCRCTTSRQQQIWHDEDPSLLLVHRFWVLVWIVYPFTGKSIASKYFDHDVEHDIIKESIIVKQNVINFKSIDFSNQFYLKLYISDAK